MDEKEIGKRIKEVRNSKNMTQKQLAESSKIDATSISRYETGVQTPNLTTLTYIAVALEISLDYLVFGNKTDFKLDAKGSKNIEEKIFESLAILLEENVIEYYNEYDGTYLQLSEDYPSYEKFISKYTNLKGFKGLIGKGFEDAKTELIKSFSQQLKNEIQANDLPF